MAFKLNIASHPDMPCPTVKRKVGVRNACLYCNACEQFFAVAFDEGRPMPDIEFISKDPLLFDCPLCHVRQTRWASEIFQTHLTEAKPA